MLFIVICFLLCSGESLLGLLVFKTHPLVFVYDIFRHNVIQHRD